MSETDESILPDEEEVLREEIIHKLMNDAENGAISLYVNAVEITTPKGVPVAIPVKQIVKITQTNRNPTQMGGYNFYRIFTMDGHYTTARTTYQWRDFIDHVFDPYALKERHGAKAGRKDDLICDP